MPVLNGIKGDDEAGDAPPNQNSESALMQKFEDTNADDIPHRNTPKKSIIRSMINIIRSIERVWTESGLDHRFIYFMALIMFSNIMCALLMMLEVVFHVRSHVLNEQFAPIESYRSPLHAVTSIFCKKCYNTDYYSDVDYESSDNEFEGSDTDSNTEI